MVIGNIFLISLGIVWIIFAVLQDLKKREIANWLNFSLIIFALTFRFFYSLFNNPDYSFFYQGLISLGVFFIMGNLLYYGKVFAGGDAKLMIALGSVIPFSNGLFASLSLTLMFFVFFLIAGALYGITFSMILAIKSRKRFAKEFLRQFKEKKKLFYISLILGIIFLALSFYEKIFLYTALLIFITPYLYISAEAIDEACMVKRINPKALTEGDWLYKDVKVKKELVKARWEGVSKEEIILLIRAKKDIWIRQGIPFGPVFLISYLALVILFAS